LAWHAIYRQVETITTLPACRERKERMIQSPIKITDELPKEHFPADADQLTAIKLRLAKITDLATNTDEKLENGAIMDSVMYSEDDIAWLLGYVAKLQGQLSQASLLIEVHRRFHHKTGCPGGIDCYVCCTEASYASNKGREVEAAEERAAALMRACADLGAELAMAANALPSRRVEGVWAAFRQIEKLCVTTA
jgi:hypothetical protein